MPSSCALRLPQEATFPPFPECAHLLGRETVHALPGDGDIPAVGVTGLFALANSPSRCASCGQGAIERNCTVIASSGKPGRQFSARANRT